jgi:predicted ferric reductase
MTPSAIDAAAALPASSAATAPLARPRTRRPPVPFEWPIHGFDVTWIIALNAALIVGMWVRHGGLDHLGGLSGAFTAVGQITALLGTYAALIQLVLMSRSPWLDQVFGMDRLAAWHRWLGFGTVVLLAGHGLFTTLGFALGDGRTVIAEFISLNTTVPWILAASVSMMLFGLVAVTSVRAARRRLSRETWYFIHLYAYLAIALGFVHQLTVGSDFTNDAAARVYWIGLYATVAALVLIFRFGQPIALSLRHRLRVASVVQEGRGVVSIYVTGRDLDRLAVRAGQWFQWRFLAGDGWWRAHPFSISAAPNGSYLRLTVKELGDDTRLLQAIRPGTRVGAEGPYGILTGARRTRSRVLLLAGGIGITPLRALLEELPAGPGDITLLYRAPSWDEVVFKDELDTLARTRGAVIHYLVGRRGTPALPHDPLGQKALAALVPDVAERDVYLCGPVGMMHAATRTLRALGVPDARIHRENFAF